LEDDEKEGNNSKKSDFYTQIRVPMYFADRQICSLHTYLLFMASQSQARVKSVVREKHLGDVIQ
jgi:hypothetical protein